MARHDPGGPDDGDEHLDRLSDVLALVTDAGIHLVVDVKSAGDVRREAAELAQVLDEQRDRDRVVISSFDIPLLLEMRRVAPWVDLVPIVSLRQNFWPPVRPEQWSGVSVLAAALVLNPLLPGRLRRAGRRLYVWFGPTEWQLLVRYFARRGVDGLIVGDVRRAATTVRAA